MLLPTMGENVIQPKILYPAKLSAKCEDKVMSFSDIKGLRNLAMSTGGNQSR